MIHWSEIAGQFARISCDLPIDEQVWDVLENLPDNRTILVACSGGADSVLLALLLFARLPDARKRLHLCHYNHGIRGDAAAADARFVSGMAEALGLPFSVGKADAALPRSEAALRTARYGWLAQVYEETEAGALCLGHHADDVLESQLMAVLSGTGPAGLAAPLNVKSFADGHVRLRPLLGWRRSEIETCLQSAGAPWCEDATNMDLAYTRNWIRQELVPKIREHFPQDISSGSQRTRRLMSEAIDALDAIVQNLALDLTVPDCFPAGVLSGQPRAIVRRALLAWWLRHRPDDRLQPAAVDLIVDSISDGCREVSVSIGDGRVLFLDRQGDLAIRNESAAPVSHWGNPTRWSWAAGPLFLPGGARLEGAIVRWENQSSVPCDKLPVPYQNADPCREAWLATDESILTVRQWEPGDRYRPLGAPGSRKLQDLFTDAKLKREQKRQLPVLLTGSDIVWVPGFPPNDIHRVPSSANSALKLTYTL